MTEIYKVSQDKIFVMNPFDSSSLDEHQIHGYCDRLRGYIDSRKQQRSFTNEPYRFYILRNEDLTVLSHKPEMIKNAQGHCYFTFDELTSGKKIVEIASSKNR